MQVMNHTSMDKRQWGLLVLVLAMAALFLTQPCSTKTVINTLPAQLSGQQGVPVSESAHLGLLTWPGELNAVRYTVEILDGVPSNLSDSRPYKSALYRNEQVYSNQILLPMGNLSEKKQTDTLYYRVQAFDLDGNALGVYTSLQPLDNHIQKITRNAPVVRSQNQDDNGTSLLYPVYAYTGNPGASQYEVEVTSQTPENLHGSAPSRYRIYSRTTTLSDLYDEKPRIGTYYWRVRGMDKTGNPVGEWSQPQQFTTLPSRNVQIGIYGDSISHGGGHLSYSPVDFAYSYSHYLDFPTINLAESGDTSAMMRERFDRDVRPFHLKYILILGGTNSLRAGVPAEDVIADLRDMGEKAREMGIRPIYLTLPPINPDNIETAFQEPTNPNWKTSFDAVNSYLRTQDHIDIAAAFDDNETLPTELALDGIHGDWVMKEKMAQVINEEIKKYVIL